ncbi:Fic family protein [Chroococcidiopsis sp. CCNUC1]|mgnify:CR=1 FL=1|uniref:Fic family protein n=1 Tax=Chroococcidiopsis sp. CCNUC1 TaxID=2653189 RepID=UPI0020217760|nr:Fic family protein [Chroococcidiopsis sp. CCNUC1]URD53601.1 Fic family protein [Chroococcidiopsis sp. CCNUC1]
MKIGALSITPEILRLIAEIDEFKGTWRTLTTLAPERLAVLKRVATIESIGSSTRIEGARLSDREVEELLGRLERQDFVSRDEQEVAGYAQVMDAVFDSYTAIPLTENYIKQLHAMLLRHSTKDERHRGEYKKLPNNVEAFDADGKSVGVIFATASPFDTPFKMQELIAWTRETLADGAWHPLIVIGLFVVVFLAIHPFQDGNGRLSRVLTTLLLLKAGYSYVPYSSLESVIEANKEGYYLALRRTQGTLDRESPDFEPWLRFFLRSLKSQKDRLATKIAREPQAEGLHPDAIEILSAARRNGRITTGEAQKLIGAPRPTVKTRLSELVKRGLLQRHGQGRGSWYGLPPAR